MRGFRRKNSAASHSMASASRTGLSLMQTTVLYLAGFTGLASSIQLSVQDPNSVKSVAKQVAYDMMTYYTGNRTGDVPGNLPQPYYWWEAGAMFGILIDYYYFTGDKTYNDVVTQGMLFQMGPNKDYMTPNQTKTEGNDDQGFWGMAAMSAAEQNFPNPPSGQPGWLELAQGVFNTQAARWDDQFCGGGLRWQIFTFNNGYDYKNTISNGVFFNLASRLARYTGNTSYADWANKAYDWTASVGFMDSNYHFYDGAHTTLGCKDINRVQWTYNVGVFLLGVANMYNFTSDNATAHDMWKTRLLGMLNGTSVFFSPTAQNVMYEVACEGPGTCDTDNYSFKAYLSRWMSATAKLAPIAHDQIMTRITASAVAAAAQCTGGSTGTKCGMKWTENGKWDGTQGVGQQMGVLSIVQSVLIDQAASTVTESTGGTSKGNAAAGSSSDRNPVLPTSPIETKDRAGAGILTALVMIWLVGGIWWMIA